MVEGPNNFTELPTQERGGQAWRDVRGAEVIADLRKENFFEYFQCDEQVLREKVIGFYNGEVTLAELEDFFRKSVVEVHKDTTIVVNGEDVVITLWGKAAMEFLLDEIDMRTGKKWIRETDENS